MYTSSWGNYNWHTTTTTTLLFKRLF